jgi:hypothetical protein
MAIRLLNSSWMVTRTICTDPTLHWLYTHSQDYIYTHTHTHTYTHARTHTHTHARWHSHTTHTFTYTTYVHPHNTNTHNTLIICHCYSVLYISPIIIIIIIYPDAFSLYPTLMYIHIDLVLVIPVYNSVLVSFVPPMLLFVPVSLGRARKQAFHG